LADGWSKSAPVSVWRQRQITLPDRIPAVFAWLATWVSCCRAAPRLMKHSCT